MRTLFILILIIFYISISTLTAQTYAKNKYGLKIIEDPKAYLQLIQQDTNQLMIPLIHYVPNLRTKYYYATKQNFTHHILYLHPIPYLRIKAAEALKMVAIDLEKLGLGILLFDAYRPYSVTEIMWLYMPDNRYAADPKLGSGHNRGTSVDISLYDLSTKKPLSMPTAFDNFTVKAHQNYPNLPSKAIINRDLLKRIMISHGFSPLSTEWWHFSIQDASSPKNDKYPILNLSFKTLDSISNINFRN